MRKWGMILWSPFSSCSVLRSEVFKLYICLIATPITVNNVAQVRDETPALKRGLRAKRNGQVGFQEPSLPRTRGVTHQRQD